MTLMYRIQVTNHHCFGYFDDTDDFYADNEFEPFDKREIALFKTIGARMREARELCNLTGVKAANLLEIEPEILYRLENGIDTAEIPLTLIHRASERYDVSMDFLFGFLGDEWERAPEVRLERETSHWAHDVSLSIFSKWATEQLRQQKRQDALSVSTVELLKAVTEIHEALNRFVELNPEFDDMRAGSKLLYWVENAAQKAEQAERDLKRCRVLPMQNEALADG